MLMPINDCHLICEWCAGAPGACRNDYFREQVRLPAGRLYCGRVTIQPGRFVQPPEDDFAMQIQHVLETCLYVDDLAKAERFYHEVLGLAVESRQEGRHVFFHCGRRMLLLFNPLASRESTDHFPGHGAFGPGHVAFAVRAEEMTAWREQLEASKVAIEKTIEWPQGGRSVYFRDPAGNSLELATPQIWGLSDDAT